MASAKDVRSYFKVSKKQSSSETVPPLLSRTVDGDVTTAEMDMVNSEVNAAYQPRKHYNKNVPDKIKKEVGRYALAHSTNDALKHFTEKYPHTKFVRTSVNNWKKKEEKGVRRMNKKGRPNLLADDLLSKVKDIIIGTRATGGVISRRMVIAIGNDVVKPNNPDVLKMYGGHIELTEGWARNILNSMKWSKRKGTTGKVDPSEALLREEKLTFQLNISKAIVNDDIPRELVINLDQTPLSYVSPGKYTFSPVGAKNVPINGVDDKRQITGTFACSLSGAFLPLQIIYEGKTRRCLPRVHKYPPDFNVTFTENHWSNTEKSVEFFLISRK